MQVQTPTHVDDLARGERDPTFGQRRDRVTDVRGRRIRSMSGRRTRTLFDPGPRLAWYDAAEGGACQSSPRGRLAACLDDELEDIGGNPSERNASSDRLAAVGLREARPSGS
jgi:hypothetical protein